MTSLEMNVVISRKKNETHRSTQFSAAQETETNEKPENLLFINIEKIGKTHRYFLIDNNDPLLLQQIHQDLNWASTIYPLCSPTLLFSRFAHRP